ncbi:acyl-CoA dehydrogenase family protein [Candidatus Poriferisodalis sp.]|uniref:acyl-CoA dehydrogenase family protein n=1 Tax=Candidatus Poriferisodalis sp. TaxID=3101277 RepID=UPI003AF6EBD8
MAHAESPLRTAGPPELSGELLARVRAGGADSDAERNPDREILAEMGRRGLMRILVPEELGGLGRHPGEFIEFTHRVSYEHPSTGWVAMTCNEEAEIFAAHLEPETVASFYAEYTDVVIAGSGVPRGIVSQVDGGWNVNGRWTFVSGCTGADWWVVANVVEGTQPKKVCHVLVPADPSFIEDTWHTVGLRGTGSHDVVLDDCFVPADRAAVVENYSLPKPNEHPFYRLPSGLRFPFPKTGVASGIARRAIDEFAALADTKTPLFASSKLAGRPDAHAAMARAEALLGAGRAFVADQLDELWTTASAAGEVTSQQHARARLACSWSVQNCIEAVETLVTAAGSTANFTASPLGGLLNDVRAVAGHFMVGSYQIDTAGRVLLGQDSGDRNF